MVRAINSKGQFVKKIAKVLSESEKEAIVDQKKDLEQTLKESEEYGTGTPATQIDKGRIQKEVAYLDRVLHEGSPRFTGKKVDELIREATQIAEILHRGLPTQDEMRHPARNPGAVRKHLRWDHNNQEAIHRYNNILRIVGPDSPLQSIEQMRKEK